MCSPGQVRPLMGSVKVLLDRQAFADMTALRNGLGMLDKAARKEFDQEIRSEFIEPLAAYMRADAVAAGRHGPRLARTIKPRAGARLRVGALNEPTWAGAVFGGRKQVREAQTMRWPNKTGRQPTRKVIYRRQTMQFLPHAGQRGWLVFPTWRRHDRELSERLVRAMDTFVRRYTGGG